MKALYGIEPDLCMVHPQIIINNNQDIVLPQYFYIQLLHLKNGDFESATDDAIKIIDSLILSATEGLLFFKTGAGGIVYFHNQEISVENFQESSGILDLKHPLDRYLLSLTQLSEILDTQIVFIASSPKVIHKCSKLHLIPATIEDFYATTSTSWLEPKMIVDIHVTLAPMTQIQWQEEEIEAPQNQGNDIHWLEINNAE